MTRRRIYILFAALFAGALLAVGPNWWVATKYRPQIPFNREVWLQTDTSGIETTPRQQMVRDMITNLLPGKTREEIERLLGPSRTHAEERRYTQADLQVREKDEQGNWKPIPHTGRGYYFDENDWDLIYEIGCEHILVYDHKGQELSPDPEYLMIRLDAEGRFESWFVEGSSLWPGIVGRKAKVTYCRTRIIPESTRPATGKVE